MHSLIPPNGPRYLRTPDAAKLLGLSPRTLEKHRCYGTGPVYRRLGGRVVYAIDDLEAWATLGTQQLWLGDGTSVTLRVVAIYDRGLGFGDVLLPRALVAAHSTTPLSDYVLVSGGADLSGVSRQFAGLHTADRGQYGDSLTATARHNALVNLVGVLAIAGFVLIGVVTTLAVATASRRRELTLLRLIGTTRSQLLRALRLETALILGTGVLAGAAVAGVCLVAFAGGVTGLPMLTVSPLLCAAILGAVILPAAAAIMLPARTMLRRRSPRIGE